MNFLLEKDTLACGCVFCIHRYKSLSVKKVVPSAACGRWPFKETDGRFLQALGSEQQ